MNLSIIEHNGGERVNRKKILVALGFLIFITLVLGFLAFSRLDVSSTLSILPENDPAMEELKLVKTLFPEEGIILCILDLKPEIDGTILENEQAIEEIKNLVQVLEGKKSVENVDSILEASKLEVKGFNIRDRKYLESDPQEMLEDPFYVGNVISKDGRTTALIVRLKEYDSELVEELKKLELESFQKAITGQPVVDFELDRSVWILSTVYPLLLFLLICGIYYLKLKNVTAAILPPLAAVLASIWVYELVGIVGIPLNILVATVGIFLIIITSAYGLHYVDRLTFHLKNSPVGVAIKKATRDEWRPIFLSAVTTSLAFLSFLFTPLKAFKQLGILVSIGIFLSLVVVFAVIPMVAMLVNLHSRNSKKVSSRERRRFLSFSARRHWRRWFILASLIMLFSSIWTIPHIEANFDSFGYFRGNSQIRLAAQKAIRSFGWAVPLYVVVEKPSPFTVEDQKYLISFVERIEKLEGVAGTISALDFWRYYSIPLPLVQVLSRTTDQLSELLNGNALRITVKAPFTDSKSFQTLAEKIESIGSSLPRDLHLHVAGEPLVMASLNEKILESQVNSVLFTLLFIFVLMLIIFKKLSKSFLAISPVVLTLVFNFFFMSVTNIWLEISTSIVASILAGLVIDYSIHLMEAKNHGIETKEQVIPVIISNSIGLALGFLTLVLSPVALYARLGTLIAFGTGFGALAVILLVDG